MKLWFTVFAFCLSNLALADGTEVIQPGGKFHIEPGEKFDITCAATPNTVLNYDVLVPAMNTPAYVLSNDPNEIKPTGLVVGSIYGTSLQTSLVKTVLVGSDTLLVLAIPGGDFSLYKKDDNKTLIERSALVIVNAKDVYQVNAAKR